MTPVQWGYVVIGIALLWVAFGDFIKPHIKRYPKTKKRR